MIQLNLINYKKNKFLNFDWYDSVKNFDMIRLIIKKIDSVKFDMIRLIIKKKILYFDWYDSVKNFDWYQKNINVLLLN